MEDESYNLPVEEFSCQLSHFKKEASIEYITKKVFDYFKLPVELKDSTTRKREVVKARQISMLFIRFATDKGSSEIGLYFGGKDHTTVLHSVKTALSDKDSSKIFKAQLRKIEKELDLNIDWDKQIFRS